MTVSTSPSSTVDSAPASTPTPSPVRRGSRRRWLVTLMFVVTTVGLLVSIVGATLVGTVGLSAAEVISSILRHVGLEGIAPLPALPAQLDAVVWQSRVPRVLLAAAVGIALSVSGAVLQSVTRNPLADPYLLGVSSGASTGAVTVLLIGVAGGVSMAAGAFVGALLSFVLLLLLIGGGRVSNPARVVLTGVLVSQFFAAITSVILMVNGTASSTRGFTYWLLGTLAGARWESTVTAGLVIIAGVLIIQFFASHLDAFTFGWDSAAALGIRVTSARIWLMVLTALITSAAVATSGAIGFIGLLVPHVVRILIGPMHRTLLPMSALLGAIFLIWTDSLARSAFAPHELPVGVITALLGAPVLAIVLRKVGSS